MPFKYEWTSVELITSTAESLKKATEQLTQVAAEMQHHGMSQALLPWTQNQWHCLDVVVKLAEACVVALPTQVLAKIQGRKSQLEIMQIKSRRDVASRKARLEAESPTPKKPRGRPRKKTQ